MYGSPQDINTHEFEKLIPSFTRFFSPLSIESRKFSLMKEESAVSEQEPIGLHDILN